MGRMCIEKGGQKGCASMRCKCRQPGLTLSVPSSAEAPAKAAMLPYGLHTHQEDTPEKHANGLMLAQHARGGECSRGRRCRKQ
jgi:hypothetical protein